MKMDLEAVQEDNQVILEEKLNLMQIRQWNLLRKRDVANLKINKFINYDICLVKEQLIYYKIIKKLYQSFAIKQ